ncbi:MAG: pro-sigmaK processing inhibitor BofA family protein [Lachnospiraceae bacterium]
MEEKRQSHFILNFIVRVIMGCGIIFFVNQFLSYQGISAAVGFNGYTVLTSGILGIPGVALLYGILLYQNL